MAMCTIHAHHIVSFFYLICGQSPVIDHSSLPLDGKGTLLLFHLYSNIDVYIS